MCCWWKNDVGKKLLWKALLSMIEDDVPARLKDKRRAIKRIGSACRHQSGRAVEDCAILCKNVAGAQRDFIYS